MAEALESQIPASRRPNIIIYDWQEDADPLNLTATVLELGGGARLSSAGALQASLGTFFGSLADKDTGICQKPSLLWPGSYTCTTPRTGSQTESSWPTG